MTTTKNNTEWSQTAGKYRIDQVQKLFLFSLHPLVVRVQESALFS
jgi:hypothetical protein